MAVFDFYVAEALGGAENEATDVGEGVGIAHDFIGDEFAHDKETRGVERLGLADDGFCHFLVDPAAKAAEQVLRGVPVIAVNDIVAFFDFVDELEAFAGGRLSVIIEADDVIASSLSVTSHQCAVLTEIFGEADSLDMRVFGGKLLDDLPYVVGATVVDEYDFVFGAWARGDCFADFLDDCRDCVFATVTGNYKREFHLEPLLNGFPLVALGGLGGGLHHSEAFERCADATYVLAFETACGKILAEAIGDVFIVVRECFDESGGVACLEAVVTLLVGYLDVTGAVAEAHVAAQVACLERFGSSWNHSALPSLP